jgi:HlyD family secretion protein
MKRLVVWVVVAVVLGTAAFGALAWYRANGDQGAAKFRTVVVKRTDVASTITATGTIVPEEVVDVGAQINGQIASFGNDVDGKSVDYRSTVEQGMVLALIDDAIYTADVATAEAQLAQALAQVRVGEANRDVALAKVEQARRDWERAQKLGNSRAISASDYDAAKSAFEQSQATVAQTEAAIGQARAQVEIATAAVQRTRRNLGFCTIQSPVSGVIIDRRVDIGQTVVASLNAPSLFLIAKDLTRMMVLVQVNEADIGQVQPGQVVSFTADAFPGDAFKGEVRKVRLNATMTQNVVTYTVEISTENSDLKLLPYLTANVRFEIARREGVLAVPGAALRWTPPADTGATGAAPGAESSAQPRSEGSGGRQGGQGGQGGREGQGGARRSRLGAGSVWVLDNGTPRKVAVRAGISDGSLTAVESEELKEGDLVIVGDAVSAAAPAADNARSPFAPQMPPGGRRGR